MMRKQRSTKSTDERPRAGRGWRALSMAGARRGGGAGSGGAARLAMLLGLAVWAAQGFGQGRVSDAALWKDAERAAGDGLYAVAEVKLGALLRDFPESPHGGEARALLGEALQRQGRGAAAIVALQPLAAGGEAGPARAAALYWTAEAKLDTGDTAGAVEAARALVRDFPEGEWAGRGRLSLAWALLRKGETAEAEAILQDLALNRREEDAGQMASVVWARWLVASGRRADAKAELERLLGGKARPRARFEAEMWLGEIALEERRLADALTHFQRITLDEKAGPREIVDRARRQEGECHLALKNWNEAREAFLRVIAEGAHEGDRLVAIRKYIEAGRGDGRLGEALEDLKELVGPKLPAPVAAVLLYAAGEAQAESGDAAAALETWRQVVERFPDTVWRALAGERRAGKLAEKGRVDEALAVMEQAARDHADPARAAEARFRLGEMAFEHGRWAAAEAAFRAAAADPAGAAIREKAGFNILACLARQDKLPEFRQEQARWTAAFPQSALRDRALDEEGRLKARLGDENGARRAWTQALELAPRSPNRWEWQIAIAESLMREGRPAEVDARVERVLADNPEPDAAARARLLRVDAGLATGKTAPEAAIEELRQALAAAPGSPWAPEIAFRLGEVYYQAHDYANAQMRLIDLARDHPGHPLADEALYFAGRAALRREDAAGAIDIFERLARAHPESPLLPEVRLGQAEALRGQAKFHEALAVYDSVMEKFAASAAAVQARLGRGDCLYRLAAEDPKRYGEALKLYQGVMEAAGERRDLRNEAAWKRGQTLEKLERQAEALEAYMTVVYESVPGTETNAPPVAPEFFWFGKAVSEAGRMLEQKQDWKGALAVYRVAEQSGGPESPMWRDRRLKLQREHFLFE